MSFESGTLSSNGIPLVPAGSQGENLPESGDPSGSRSAIASAVMDSPSIMARRRFTSKFLKGLVYAAGATVCLLLLALMGYILVRGVPGISWSFLTSQSSYVRKVIGILPNILNTLYIVLVAMVIAVPLGVCAAVYLHEYARNKGLVKVIGFAVETLTGIPSVIFGLVGMLFFIQLMGLQAGILAGGLTLVVMVLPTIISNTLESLKAVPNSLREGSLALGSGKWHMIRTVVLPNAINGIVTGCILAIGRIVGESAALLYTAGFGLVLNGFLASLQSSSATLTVALYVYATERGEVGVAFSVATVLLILTLLLNVLASLSAARLGHHGEEK
ncbi:MAG: phosphate ABC transporter permease PstA [Coriobacteriales bacterium]|nr:phosphate ABC transporter permease PstA [Coriobacteriales bacterium]